MGIFILIMKSVIFGALAAFSAAQDFYPGSGRNLQSANSTNETSLTFDSMHGSGGGLANRLPKDCVFPFVYKGVPTTDAPPRALKISPGVLTTLSMCLAKKESHGKPALNLWNSTTRTLLPF